MKCPKCGAFLSEGVTSCPFCHATISSNETYDFDLQYTLTFNDADEIRKAVSDAETGGSTANGSEFSDDVADKIARLEARRKARAEKRNSKGIKNIKKAFKDKPAVNKPAARTDSNICTVKEPPVKPKKKTAYKPIPKPSRVFLLSAVSVIVVIALIIGVINAFASFVNSGVEYPTVYMKNNELYMLYNDKVTTMSSNMIAEASQPQATEEPKATKTPDDDDEDSSEKTTASPAPTTEPVNVNETDLVKVSENGEGVFYFENFNKSANCGDLVYISSGKKKSKVTISANVFSDIEVSSDGKSVLALKNATQSGEKGELIYWSTGDSAITDIDANIRSGVFCFSKDAKSAVYLKNYNSDSESGELNTISFTKSGAHTAKLDDNVYALFGSNYKSDIFVYARNYSKDSGTFDVCSASAAGNPVMLGEKSKLAPIVSDTDDTAYVYSNENQGYHNLSRVNLKSGEQKQVADEITEVVKVSKDEKSVIYNKRYDGNVMDYFYVKSAGESPQKIVENITAFDGDNHANIIQFDASDDLSEIVCITGFIQEKEYGTLSRISINRGVVGQPEKIADSAYSCDIANNGSVIRYAADYSIVSSTVSIYQQKGKKNIKLASEVGDLAFTFDRTGDYTVYATGYNSEVKSGNVSIVNNSGKVNNIMSNANKYGVKDNGEVILVSNVKDPSNEYSPGELYSVNRSGSKVKLMDTDVTKILSYKG